MFDNSISVLSKAVRKIKKYLHIAEIIAQLIFISYYAYLLVIHINEVVLLASYTALFILGTLLLFIKMFEGDPYNKKERVIKKKWQRAMRFVAWGGRILVIGYNIYYLMQNGISNVGLLFLVLSGVILILEILLFVITSIISKYYELFVYALKMDYEYMYREEDDISKKPISRILNEANQEKDYEEDVNELYVEHEIYGTIKRYIEDDDIVINLKRRELEKKLLTYYNRSLDYYTDIEYLVNLLKDVNAIQKDKETEVHFYVLKFLLINHIDHVYVGLSKQATRLVLSGLSLYRDNKEEYVIDIIFLTIIKLLLSDNDWQEFVPERKAELLRLKKRELTVPEQMIDDVNKILKSAANEYEIYEQGTVTGEIKSLVKKGVMKNVSKTVKNSVRNIFKRNKKQ